MKKAAFYTLGCKVNQYETEAVSEMFAADGYQIVGFDSSADVYFINTCTVTAMSDKKSRQIIHRVKKINPNAIIVVAGCYAQTNPDAVLGIDGVNLIIGTNGRKNIISLLKNIDCNSKVSAVDDITDVYEFENMTVSDYSERNRAYIKIQEGCNQFCSYCIIPYARGNIRSRNPEEVIDEAKRLALKGYKEIVLTGIHVASYGADLGYTNLIKLLERVNDIEQIERIRLSSIEPMAIDADFLSKAAKLEKVCHHFHISLQSGCDETLRRMNRKYTTDEFRQIAKSLKDNFDDVAITTDIMVGFPQESDEEFEKSYNFAKEIGFADMHVFQYSRRPGTPANDMPCQIPSETKHLRSTKMLQLAANMRKAFMNRFLNTVQTVLVENEISPGVYQGKTGNYINVLIESDKNISNTVVLVKLCSVSDDNMEGTLVLNA